MIQVIKKNLIPAPTVLCRKNCFDKLGGFDESIVFSDWDMWLRILAFWGMGFIDEPTALYRVHDRNTSIGNDPLLTTQRKVAAAERIAAKAKSVGGKFLNPEIQLQLLRAPELFEREISLCHLDNFFLGCQRGTIADALPHLFNAIKAAPEKFLSPRRVGAIVKQTLVAITRSTP